MQCSVFESLFEDQPELFKDYQWINSEQGMPLWVRPGVEWTLDDEDDDELDYLNY